MAADFDNRPTEDARARAGARATRANRRSARFSVIRGGGEFQGTSADGLMRRGKARERNAGTSDTRLSPTSADITHPRCHRAARRVASQSRGVAPSLLGDANPARGNSAAAASPLRAKWTDRWTNRRSLSPLGHCVWWRAVLTAKIRRGAWPSTVGSQHSSIQRTIKEKAHNPLHLLRQAVRTCASACVRAYVRTCVFTTRVLSPFSLLPQASFLSRTCVRAYRHRIARPPPTSSSRRSTSLPPIRQHTPPSVVPFSRKRALPPAIAAPSIAAVLRRVARRWDFGVRCSYIGMAADALILSYRLSADKDGLCWLNYLQSIKIGHAGILVSSAI